MCISRRWQAPFRVAYYHERENRKRAEKTSGEFWPIATGSGAATGRDRAFLGSQLDAWPYRGPSGGRLRTGAKGLAFPHTLSATGC